MSITKEKITCPVCDRQAIEENICPNCETDLSVLRMLWQLPPVTSKSVPQVFLWLFLVIMVLMGVMVGWLSILSLKS